VPVPPTTAQSSFCPTKATAGPVNCITWPGPLDEIIRELPTASQSRGTRPQNTNAARAPTVSRRTHPVLTNPIPGLSAQSQSRVCWRLRSMPVSYRVAASVSKYTGTARRNTETCSHARRRRRTFLSAYPISTHARLSNPIAPCDPLLSLKKKTAGYHADANSLSLTLT
jgi:hypothetical protein